MSLEAGPDSNRHWPSLAGECAYPFRVNPPPKAPNLPTDGLDFTLEKDDNFGVSGAALERYLRHRPLRFKGSRKQRPALCFKLSVHDRFRCPPREPPQISDADRQEMWRPHRQGPEAPVGDDEKALGETARASTNFKWSFLTAQ